jgi:hypothetical protein
LIQSNSDLAVRAAAGCRALYIGKQQLEFFLHIPAELDMRKLKLDLRAMLPNANNASIAMDIV